MTVAVAAPAGGDGARPNALASALRGTGDMLVPAGVVCFGVLLIIPLSPLLIYGYGALPGFGVPAADWRS